MSILEACQAELLKNNFACDIVPDTMAAKELLKAEVRKLAPKTVSYADSQTLRATGILAYLKASEDFTFIDTFSEEDSFKEQIARKKEALTVDLFLTGTNAITKGGLLINLDMLGNRVAGITFGPKKVILTVGRNKIVSDLAAAFQKIREYTAPKNAARHPALKTPCITTKHCVDCSSTHRICNSWSIIEKSYPKGRIQVILIDEDLGI